MNQKIRTKQMPAKLRRRALIVLATVVPALGAALALPRFVDVDAGLLAPVQLSPEVIASLAAEGARAAIERAPTPDRVAAPAQPTGPHAGGDLILSVDLRRPTFPQGAAVRARVSLHNDSLAAFHVPAPGEPQPTLRIAVLDAAGETVRSVVEDALDPMPHRTCRLESGGDVSWSVDVVAPGEAPLPVGTYYLAAVYDTSPAWKRTGLDVWTAPGGAVSADRARFEITAAE